MPFTGQKSLDLNGRRMSCEICAGTFCSRDFHTDEEVELFDSIAIRVKETMRYRLEDAINNIPTETVDDELYIKLIDVIAIISDYD